MAKYYYCPLFLPASMRQPGTIINQASYQPGLTVGGETTSAVSALLAAGVDLSVYSPFHGSLTELPCVLPGQIPIFGPQNAPPSNNSKSNIRSLARQAPTNGQEGTDGNVRNKWPDPGFISTPYFEGTDVESFNDGGQVFHEMGPHMPSWTNDIGATVTNIERPLWNRTPILYVDINRRMVIETPDAFVDGPFLAGGWVEKQWWEVNQDYPWTIQGPAVGPPVTGQNPYIV